MRTPLFVLTLLTTLCLWQGNTFAGGPGDSQCNADIAVVGINSFATITAFAPNESCGSTTGDQSYWYEYTAVADGPHTATACGLNGTDTYLKIHTNGPCGATANCIANDDLCGYPPGESEASVTLLTGETMYIEWYDRWGNTGVTWELIAPTPPPPPTPGETCADAIVVGLGTHTVEPLVGSGADNTCFGSGATAARWYSFTPAVSGEHTISACGEGLDTRLSLYEGDCGFVTCLALDDDACGYPPGESEITIDLTAPDLPPGSLGLIAGNTYYIQWDDRWSSSGFNFSIAGPAPPPPPAAIPTMGQWGMIMFLLIMLSLGTATAMNLKGRMATANGSVSVSNKLLPFNKATYPKVLIATYIAVAAIFGVAMAFGYELTNADIPGSLIATPILAYILHLFTGSKK